MAKNRLWTLILHRIVLVGPSSDVRVRLGIGQSFQKWAREKEGSFMNDQTRPNITTSTPDLSLHSRNMNTIALLLSQVHAVVLVTKTLYSERRIKLSQDEA